MLVSVVMYNVVLCHGKIWLCKITICSADLRVPVCYRCGSAFGKRFGKIYLFLTRFFAYVCYRGANTSNMVHKNSS